MPGIAALVNRAVPDQSSIQMFFNTDSGNLGLGMMSGQSTHNDPKIFYDNQTQGTATTGNIVKPSPMGAAFVNGVHVIVGFTNSVNKTNISTGMDVSMLSPIYQTLATTGLDFHTAIAISSSGGTPDNTGSAFIYYLDINQDPTKGTLKEYRLSDFNTNNLKNAPSVAGTSQLAAYYVDQTKRYVILQGPDGDLYEYEANSGSTNHIDSVSGVRTGSTLAVTYLEGKTYLYYTNTNLKMFRVIKSNGQWGSPQTLDFIVDASSQLSTVIANGKNHLFFLPTGNTGNHFEHETDDLAAQ